MLMNSSFSFFRSLVLVVSWLDVSGQVWIFLKEAERRTLAGSQEEGWAPGLLECYLTPPAVLEMEQEARWGTELGNLLHFWSRLLPCWAGVAGWSRLQLGLREHISTAWQLNFYFLTRSVHCKFKLLLTSSTHFTSYNLLLYVLWSLVCMLLC